MNLNSKLIIRVSATAKKNNKFEWIEIDERDVNKCTANHKGFIY